MEREKVLPGTVSVYGRERENQKALKIQYFETKAMRGQRLNYQRDVDDYWRTNKKNL